MIDRIKLEHPLTVNDKGVECECLDGCGKQFTYIEVYMAGQEWIENSGHDVDVAYIMVCTDCPNPRTGLIVAYLDLNGAIMGTIYALEGW